MQFVYALQCQKCKYEYVQKDVFSPTASSICVDGVWFYSGGERDVHGLYCCTGCIKWFQKHTRGLYKDGIKRVWCRLTRHEVCYYPYTQWLESEKRTMKFVSHFKKKEMEKKKEKNTKRKSKRKRKHEKTNVEDVPATAEAPVIEITDAPPLDVSKTIRAHEQSMKTLRSFLTLCCSTPDTDQNHISPAVYSVVSTQLDVLQTLTDTLKEHI